MKPQILHFCSCALVALIWAACNTSHPQQPDMETEAKQTGKDLLEVKKDKKDGYFAEFQDYKQRAQIKLNNMEASIELFSKGLSREKAKNDVYHNRVSEAQHKITGLRKKLEEFSEEGKEKLDKFELDFNQELTDLDKQIHNLNSNP